MLDTKVLRSNERDESTHPQRDTDEGNSTRDKRRLATVIGREYAPDPSRMLEALNLLLNAAPAALDEPAECQSGDVKEAH